MAIITNVAEWAADHADTEARENRAKRRAERPVRGKHANRYKNAAAESRAYARKARAGK